MVPELDVVQLDALRLRAPAVNLERLLVLGAAVVPDAVERPAVNLERLLVLGLAAPSSAFKVGRVVRSI